MVSLYLSSSMEAASVPSSNLRLPNNSFSPIQCVRTTTNFLPKLSVRALARKPTDSGAEDNTPLPNNDNGALISPQVLKIYSIDRKKLFNLN